MIEDPLVEGILSKEFNKGSVVSVDAAQDGLKLTKTKRAVRASASSGRTTNGRTTKAKIKA